jgi:hypothetical protein
VVHQSQKPGDSGGGGRKAWFGEKVGKKMAPRSNQVHSTVLDQ